VIALDTNVLVRFLTRDDAEQSLLVDALVETLDTENGGYVSRDVMLELVWVLRKGYGFRRPEIARALQALMEAEEFEIEDEAAVHQALDGYSQGGPGFADHLILSVSKARACQTLATLDRKLARLDGVTLLVSEKP
jgi:predicted nucleic-acid-binding protein